MIEFDSGIVIISYLFNLLLPYYVHHTEAGFVSIIDLTLWSLRDAAVNSNDMMTSSSGNIFRVTGQLCGEFTGPRWIPRTKASDAELWCFLWSAFE